MPSWAILLFPVLRANPTVPHLSQKHENITVSLFSETVYCIRICVYFFWKQEEGWWERGGVILYPCLNYDDTYMRLAKCPKYNYYLQPDIKAEAVKNCNPMYLLSSCFWSIISLSTGNDLLSSFGNELHSLKLFLHEQFHHHETINIENVSQSIELRWFPVEFNYTQILHLTCIIYYCWEKQLWVPPACHILSTEMVQFKRYKGA